MKKQTKKDIKGTQLYYEKLFLDGRYHTLREELELNLKKDPNHVDNLIKIAAVYRELKHYS